MTPENSEHKPSKISTRKSSECHLQSAELKPFMPGVPGALGASPELSDPLSPVQGDRIFLC